ncbi:uncharacterized protein LOC125810992 [Solanum verrucosum]|uniref:uncharacterized protein LOC125810992 n=1 Tax=Solanum verrucosum TaxID=315347 RepID=UPI0020D06054|nr:uncharacterized protein LOC125810992 [Solanum verrucosum]
MVDHNTEERNGLNFARILIEVEMGTQLPEVMKFKNEKGRLIEQHVQYDWEPTLYGYGSGFYKAAWSVVGEDVTNAVLEFFQNSKILKQINATSFALIPKIEEFLEKVLDGFGFPEQFIKWIMLGVTTTMFSIKVNGENYGFFAGKRGLRQGDPASPLLFVLVMEYLLRTLQTMSGMPEFRFHPMCKKVQLTHLIFVDDLMIFWKGNVASVSRVMEALAHFSTATGLEANLDKSSIFLARVDENTRRQILARTGFSVVIFPIKYLGLPLSPKKWTNTDCHSLIDKLTKKITVTYSKQLSYADRLQICRNFLWGSSAAKRKIALVSWEKVCFPKRQGGLNIKGSNNWNIASVSQLIWQIIENKEAL